MTINLSIIDAARQLVQKIDVSDEAVEISDYPGVFVAKSGCAEIQAYDFFSENDVRYCVGVLRK